VTATLDLEQAPRARPRLLDPAWPIWLLTFGVPVTYFLGFSAFVWVLPAIVFGVVLAVRRSVRFPLALVPFTALVLWIPATAVKLPALGSLPVFGYRWLLWASALAAALWLCNTSTRLVPTYRIVNMLAGLWIALVGFGYLAIMLPTFEAPSLLQRVVPQALAGNRFFFDLTVIRFANLQNFVTGEVPRPAAPLPFSNGWGAAFALLTPFFIVSWLTAVSFRRRVLGWLLVAASIVPVAVSTNRGMWLSLAVTLVYFALRRALVGDARPLLVVIVLAVLIPTLVLATPLEKVVFTRLDSTEESNTTRQNLYQEAFDGTKASPLLGYGAPRTPDQPPPIGTHGLFWYAMYSHGFPGVALLVVALAALLGWTARARTPTALWAHITIVMFSIQIFFYGLLPHVVLLGFAAGIAWRENNPIEAAEELR
jgi:O-antigen ligase